MTVGSTEISVTHGAVYASEERPLLWDIYRPRITEGRTPAVLVLHGGGWRQGDRSMVSDACKAFAGQGYVAIAPQYRLIGEVAWPVPLRDIETAIGSLHASAEPLGIDPHAIFLAGYSAGAHLALLAASQSPKTSGESNRVPSSRRGGYGVAAVAAFYPPIRLDASHAGLLGLEVDDLSVISPLSHAHQLPPTFIVCGDGDRLTPAEFSLELYRAIRAADGVADIRLFSGLIHEFVSLPGMMDITIRQAVEFFRRTVLQQRPFNEALQELQRWWDAQIKQ
jgi:acetyl esterase/lipase